MKKLYTSIFLAAIVISAIAATVKISDLPISTSPSTNTFIEIADMNAVTKSSKYLLTNLVAQGGTALLNSVVATNGITAGASTFTSTVDATGAIIARKAFQQYQGTLTHAGTVTLDFDAATTDNTLTLTGNVTLATSNLATNRTYIVRFLNTQATNCTPTFPSWNFIGGAPSTLTAYKVSMLELKAYGANDTNVTAYFGESQ